MEETRVELTMDDIAEILGVTRATIYNRQRVGELPAGNGLDVVRAAIRKEELRIEEMRKRFSKKVAERLVVIS